jgi:hypothetical protein
VLSTKWSRNSSWSDGKTCRTYRAMGIDKLGFYRPIPRSAQGYVYALVVTDYFTKYVMTFPMRSATAKALTKCVEEQIFLVYGTPRMLICDNGTQLRADLFERCARGTKSKYSIRPITIPVPIRPNERIEWSRP